MSARVISFAEARASRGQSCPQAVRLGDRVRRRSSLAEGTVLDFRGSGAAADPVEALVQWAWAREFVPVVHLEGAR